MEKELRTETQHLFMKCALFELLIADAFSFETHLNEKIQSLIRMVQFAQGQLPPEMRFSPQILVADDAFSAMLRILPQLLRFCIICLTHRREIVKMSALKVIKFVLETQGCSLDFTMVFILKGMFLTFPKSQQSGQAQQSDLNKPEAEKNLDESPNPKQASASKTAEMKNENSSPRKSKVKIVTDDFDFAALVGEEEAATVTIGDFLFSGTHSVLNPQSKGGNQSESNVVAYPEAKEYATIYDSIKEPQSGFNTALSNIFTHVLDTFISVLSSISSHILHSIFYDVIEETIANQPKARRLSCSGKDMLSQSNRRVQPNEIKVFACKIAEKIITICQGDLLISHQMLNALVDQFCSTQP